VVKYIAMKCSASISDGTVIKFKKWRHRAERDGTPFALLSIKRVNVLLMFAYIVDGRSVSVKRRTSMCRRQDVCGASVFEQWEMPRRP